MSANELYNLKWNDFQATLSSAVGGLLEESDFVDVTLACDGQSFTAHKVVLSACSPYFKKLLKRNPCKHPIIILKDVNATILNSLIRFIYHGGVDVPQDMLDEFLRTAQSLEIRGLADNEVPKQDSAPPVKRQRLSLPSRSISPPQTESRSRNVSYLPVEKARSLLSSSSQQSSSSVNYISLEKAKSLVSSMSGSSSSGSNYIPSERVRSLISSSSSRQSAGDSGKDSRQDHEVTPRSLKHAQQSESLADSNAGQGGYEDSGSGFGSEKDPSEGVNVKQECEDDIQIVDSDPYAKVEPPQDDSMSNPVGDESDMAMGSVDAGPSMMEGGLDDSQFYGEFSAEGGSWCNADEMRDRTCSICNKVFSTVGSKKLHIQNVHDEKPLDEYEQCHVCHAKLKTRHYLTKHLNRKHNIYVQRKSF